jgi:P-type E1-E2 ATPase
MMFSVMALSNERGIEVLEPDGFRAEVGMGVTAVWGDKEILVGTDKYLQANDIQIPEIIAQAVSGQTQQGRTALLVANDMKPVGLIAIADEVRPETPRVISSLKKDFGIEKIIMITGDNHRVAKAIAAQIGMDDFQAELLPEQKQELVRGLQRDGHLVGMIGDGINDAPALALADIGFAMGTAGTDVAIETADVTLMNDDLSRVAEFVWMSQKVLRRIKLNIFFSIIYNVVGLFLASLGMLTPVLAVIFQEAGCITVVFSSTLLLWSKTNLYSHSSNQGIVDD